MQKTNDFILNRLNWKAKQFGLPSEFSFFFKDLSPTLQDFLNEYLQKREPGIPALFFTKPTKEWTLVCTRKIIYSDNKNVSEISPGRIVEIRPNASGKCLEGKVNLQQARKTEWNELIVVDDSNRKHVIYANKGEELFALWNILLMAASLGDLNP